MAGQQDVDQFLWDLERALSHVDGEERRQLLRQAEDRLHEVAEDFARAEGAEDLHWTHYVQATAEVGPPEEMAARLTGEPLPDKPMQHKRMWQVVWGVLAVIVIVLAIAWFSHGDLETVGAWSGTEEGLTDQRALTFNVSQDADSVFLNVVITPANANATARVTVLDGGSNLVLERQATVQEHIERAQYLTGEPGTWRVLIDFQRYTGSWTIDARQELP